MKWLRESRDGGVLLTATLFGAHPFLLELHADGGYAGPQFQAGLAQVMRQVGIGTVKRSDTTVVGQFDFELRRTLPMP